jgi:hypothetical protein
MLYEVTLKGFDGSTDRTDHLIKWIVATSRSALENWLDASGLLDFLACDPIRLPSSLEAITDGDFVVGREAPEVAKNWKDQSRKETNGTG